MTDVPIRTSRWFLFHSVLIVSFDIMIKNVNGFVESRITNLQGFVVESGVFLGVGAWKVLREEKRLRFRRRIAVFTRKTLIAMKL
jgi:hypothetical protein